MRRQISLIAATRNRIGPPAGGSFRIGAAAADDPAGLVERFDAPYLRMGVLFARIPADRTDDDMIVDDGASYAVRINVAFNKLQTP